MNWKPKDKLFVNPYGWNSKPSREDEIEYIRKDALLEYLLKEMDRLGEIIPDASNDDPTRMELRYLGEYMATERLIDKIESI